jgi:hypothetical protein
VKEKWTFLIIADEPRGNPIQVRVILRDAEAPDRAAKLQVGVDGKPVQVDEAEHDYEAPEWKANQILAEKSGDETLLERMKDRLREALVG